MQKVRNINNGFGYLKQSVDALITTPKNPVLCTFFKRKNLMNWFKKGPIWNVFVDKKKKK